MSVQVQELPEPSWQVLLTRKLPLFGHRNWIVVADAAYPAQSATGITTILADADQLHVLQQVLSAIAASNHVKPNIYTDRELSFVEERDAPGINAYRQQLGRILEGSEVHALPHEEIIAKLDCVAGTFHVLILKTRLAIPYTSVFLELDCAYWNASAEVRLRATISRE